MKRLFVTFALTLIMGFISLATARAADIRNPGSLPEYSVCPNEAKARPESGSTFDCQGKCLVYDRTGKPVIPKEFPSKRVTD
jgi:hypothetical protein